MSPYQSHAAQPEQSENRSFLQTFSLVLKDALAVLFRPVKTIHAAAARDLPSDQLMGLLGCLMGMTAILACFLFTLTPPEGFGAAKPFANIDDIKSGDGYNGVFSAAHFNAVICVFGLSLQLISFGVLFIFVKIMEGKGTFLQFCSACLPVLAMWFLFCVLEVCLIAFWSVAGSSVAGGDRQLYLLSCAIPAAASLITIALGVVVTRFAGGVNYSRAFIAVALLVAIIPAILYWLGQI